MIPFVGNNGEPLANGFINTYLAGTTTPAATYTTSAGSVNNPISIPLGPDGRLPNEVWLVSGTTYKFVPTYASGSLVTGPTYDNITGINDPLSFSSLTLTSLTVSGTSTLGAITGTTGAFSGALTALSTAITNALTAGSAAITGALSAAAATFTGLLDISGAAAGQIKFPAAQNASSNVNTLDDYEESDAWTPAVTFVTPGNLAVTYTTQAGSYTKVGRLVTLTAIIQTATFTHTTASGNFLITGVPFTSKNIANGQSYVGSLVLAGVTKASYTQFVPVISVNDNKIGILCSGSAQARSFLAFGDLPTGTNKSFELTIQFETA